MQILRKIISLKKLRIVLFLVAGIVPGSVSTFILMNFVENSSKESINLFDRLNHDSIMLSDTYRIAKSLNVLSAQSNVFCIVAKLNNELFFNREEVKSCLQLIFGKKVKQIYAKQNTIEIEIHFGLPKELYLLWVILVVSLGAISLLLVLFTQKLSAKLLELKYDSEIKLSEIAKRVGHDSRSPLAAIETILYVGNLSKESEAILRSSITKLRQIYKDLLPGKNVLNFGQVCSFEISKVIREVVSEVKVGAIKSKNIDIELKNSVELIAKGIPIEFSRILANVLNNSVESISEETGKVVIAHYKVKKYACIEVVDSGHGIPRNILKQLGQKVITYGKTDGHGYGLFYSKRKILEWQGKFEIDSKQGEGTRVRLYLLLHN